MTDREREILKLIEADPLVTQETLATKLGIQRASVAVHISNLMKKGYIKGRGYIVDASPYIVVIGCTNMDIIATPDQALIPHDSNIGSVITRPGGVGRNIASNLSSLSLPIHFISAVGNDDFGHKVLDGLNHRGIHTSGVMVHPSMPTSTYLFINDQTGDMHVAISQMKIVEALDSAYLSQWSKLIEGARALVLDTNLKEDALHYLLTQYAHLPIYIDPVSTAKAKKVKNLLGHIHFLKPNLIEAEVLTGLHRAEGEGNVAYGERLAVALIEKGVTEVALTIGAEGVIYAEGQQVAHYESHPVEIFNTTGAGDAFFAGYVYGAFHGLAPVVKIQVAQRCAVHQMSHSEAVLNESLLKI